MTTVQAAAPLEKETAAASISSCCITAKTTSSAEAYDYDLNWLP